MPNLSELVQIAESLETKAVSAHPERCVSVRNRHASCQKCVVLCPGSAITVEDNVLTLDAASCVACGACTTVCPTEALDSLLPTNKELASTLAAVLEKTCTQAFIACARVAAVEEGDPHGFAEVPCLARVDESILLEVASCGAQRIALIDGTCATCKYGSCDTLIEAVVRGANQMLREINHPVMVERLSGFPEEIKLANKQGLLGESRRAFFTGAGLQAGQVASKAAEVMVFKKEETVVPTLRDRLQMLDSGTMPQFSPVRHMGVLDALDRMGFGEEGVLNTRLFGSVELDERECTACGMCAVFCPTGALRKSPVKATVSGGSYLEFSAAECVQCDLCKDACPKNCIVVSPLVSFDEVFDFEPRLLHIPDPPKPTGILASLKMSN